MSENPPQPVEGLEIHQVPDGMVVYDTAADRVHYLNPSASVVLSFCDGRRDVAELAELVRSAWELDEAPVAEVEACIVQLRGEGVLA